MAFLRRRAKEADSNILPFSDLCNDAPIPTGDCSLGAIKDSWKQALRDLEQEGKLVVTMVSRQPPRDILRWVVQVK